MKYYGYYFHKAYFYKNLKEIVQLELLYEMIDEQKVHYCMDNGDQYTATESILKNVCKPSETIGADLRNFIKIDTIGKDISDLIKARRGTILCDELGI